MTKVHNQNEKESKGSFRRNWSPAEQNVSGNSEIERSLKFWLVFEKKLL